MIQNDQLIRDVGEIKGKLDMLIDLHKTNDKRIGAVEKKVWYSSGANAVIAIVVTFVMNKVGLPRLG